MVAMARALVSQPRLLLLDEPSAALAPNVVDEIFDKIVEIKSEGVSILLVEQNARRALAIADYGYVLEVGLNRYEGEGRDLLHDPNVVRLYLGGMMDQAEPRQRSRMSGPRLEPRDRRMLAGDDGPAAQRAMGIVVQLAEAVDAPSLVDIEATHIDGCLAVGQVSADLPERFAAEGGRVRVPSTLNVSSLDLLHPDHSEGDAETRALARRIMDTYVAMGCQPTWTCAPYFLEERPALGAHVAWAESNAIVFVNSVLGGADRSER